MRFAKWTFRLSGIYGIVLLSPFYFLERAIGEAGVPIAHPEYFYGFVGTALAFQVIFLMISVDPSRYRKLMVAAVLEKLAFGIPAVLLWSGGRIGGDVVSLGGVDLVWAALFVVSFIKTPRAFAGDR